MREESEAIQVFTPEMIDTMARIWTRSSVSLMDVRHKYIYPEHPLQHYKMPSSMLVYAYGGTANVQLNETAFAMERFGLFHGGKGTMLSILPDEVMLGSYMVLFKAETPPFFKKDLQRLLEQVNPFVQQFGYAPSNPVWLIRLFQQMMESWSRATAMNHFHTKNLLYQSMHEIYRDLENEEAKFLQPDPVISAKRYLDEHYMQPIMFQEIADMFGISGGQLTRLFKKREGMSLQQYLTLKRLEVAQHHLKHTNTTVKEIAHGCGFFDENLLLRIFKKHHMMSPGEYRKKLTMSMQDLCVDNDYQHLYNEKGLENLAKSQRDGEFTMFGQTRSKQMILAAAMSLLLLLSACGTNAPANSAQNTPAAATTQTPAANTLTNQEVARNEAFPRTVQDANGGVTVLEQPQRVAVAYWGLVQHLLVFDVSSVALALPFTEQAAGLHGEFYAPFTDSKEELVIIGENTTVNFEALLAYEPDLIIATSNMDQEIIDHLEKIGTTFVLDTEQINMYGDWTPTVTKLGEVLGQEEVAERVITEYRNKEEQARQALSGVEGTVAFLQIREKAAYLQGGEGSSGAAIELYYKELGLPGHDREGGQISLEGLAEFNPDHIFLGYFNFDDPSLPAVTDTWSETEVWKNLKAVQNNQVYSINGSLALGGGPIGSSYGIEAVVEALGTR